MTTNEAYEAIKAILNPMLVSEGTVRAVIGLETLVGKARMLDAAIGGGDDGDVHGV